MQPWAQCINALLWDTIQYLFSRSVEAHVFPWNSDVVMGLFNVVPFYQTLRKLKYKLWVEDNLCSIFSTNSFVRVMQGMYRYYNQHSYKVYFPGWKIVIEKHSIAAFSCYGNWFHKPLDFCRRRWGLWFETYYYQNWCVNIYTLSYSQREYTFSF